MIQILNLTPETWSSFLMSCVEFVCKADESTEFIGKHREREIRKGNKGEGINYYKGFLTAPRLAGFSKFSAMKRTSSKTDCGI